ncbi:MAG: hypothetical protein ACK4MM_05975 [Fervidobacterium sp.]
MRLSKLRILIIISLIVLSIPFALAAVLNFHGLSYSFLTGQRINGTVTFISVEEPENNVSADVINGNWDLQVQYDGNKTQHILIIVNDTKNLGYNHFIVRASHPVSQQVCSFRTITFENFFFDIADGNMLTPELTVEIEGTQYKNIRLNGGQQSNNITVCLIAGKIYKINIYASDTTGKKSGTYSILYPFR